MIIDMNGVSKSFGAKTVLRDIDLKIEDHDRIGLIGENGAGKSTLLNIIIGDLEYDTGTYAKGTGKKLGFLRQDSGLSLGGTVISEMRSVFKDVMESEDRMHSLEHRMATLEHGSEEYHNLLLEYEHEKNFFEANDGYNIEVKINTILTGMGFSSFDPQTPVETLSGGERTRLALAKLLLEGPDLLMLDEPTNHLDFKTLTWLEDYLMSYKGAILTVSHDRYFLDKIVNTVCEVENKTLIRYNAGYTKYLDLKAARIARMQKEYDRQMREIAELEDFIARNKVRASTTKRAQAREKEIEHMEIKERPTPPPKPPKFRFGYEREPVKDVLYVKNLKLVAGEGMDKKLLNPCVDLEVRRGEKIALVGMNGVGKSTFIKTLLGIVPKESGIIEWGRNVRTGYYDQHNSYLTGSKTMLDEMWDMFPRSDELTLRTALGRARLTGENVFKRIDVLSGGEKARLSFAALTLKDANVLLLDEPTNHMDISCKEALDEALREYTGTIIMVSHDRYLLNRVPTKIIEMFPDHLTAYDGGYDDYMRLKEEVLAPVKEEKKPSVNETVYYRSKQQKSEDAKKRNRLKAVEKEISDADERLAVIEQEMANPETCADYEKMSALCAEMEELKNRQNELMDEWAELSEELS
ncbi:MAG: ABC-F family ATP-binding cassette domain-containing protein [Oscillospiraceae bacterium]|nr:ABC-F family ATP-binding cassette domain-containing protein [Oscillospiraceae bacterium]